LISEIFKFEMKFKFTKFNVVRSNSKLLWADALSGLPKSDFYGEFQEIELLVSRRDPLLACVKVGLTFVWRV